ncbi:DUF6603 domain-containing protein [Paraburkholderia terrae]|uniref:DUF6603 domain-containing protein n=1 Tax=Paraburkholderia terrae TaxID=311230 RepID=UPI002048FDCE|nr:DUF6603 domain-containing protein [Paraburkholderia terrae]BDC42663.1 hypothetical protein PTKU15_59600 [Paraburkholderia terrae]
MPGAEINQYAAELGTQLSAVGTQPANRIASLLQAATALAALADRSAGSMTSAEWKTAVSQWEAARDAFGAVLAKALLGPLADIPGVAALADDLGKLSTEGIHGSVDLGPVHLEVASSMLVIQPPEFSDLAGTPDPVTIGPYQVGEVAASIASPFGDGGPGGGSLVRLPAAGGFGGTLELPLGAVQVTASAVLGTINGQPSFIAVLGVQFLPPVQLSFGFSLDRVGGIVGVNRRLDPEALRAAVRTGGAGDVLFAVKPPASPLSLVTAIDRFFPAQPGTHLVGPTLKLAWLSFGPAGSLLGLDLGVIVELPAGRVAVLGVGRIAIPGLDVLLNLRLDVLGLVDPVEQLVSVDASLVDSSVLGIFEVYGDGAMRLSWGSSAYFVVSVGGFFPGFNPEPARLPALRRVGMTVNNPVPIIDIRTEGYFAFTTNTLQFGGRMEVSISLGIEAHGFVEVDALVQFRPFHFEAHIAAGFGVSVEGFSFASVTLSGMIGGPGPIVIRGTLSISVFLFSLDWDETFTLGSGPADALPAPVSLLKLIAEELGKPQSVQSASIADSQVVLKPRPGTPELAAVPATGALQVLQRRAPLGLLIDRADGRPLGGPQGVKVDGGSGDVTERFSPGSYITLTQAEALNRPPFDVLPAGRVLSLADPPLDANRTAEDREVEQIIIVGNRIKREHEWTLLTPLGELSAMVGAAGRPPALSDAAPVITATAEQWRASNTAEVFGSATAAHQSARYRGGIALAASDAAAPVDLATV